jgi:secreted trypsin-like serine protease
MKTLKSKVAPRLLATLAMLAGSWMYSATAGAQSCPATLPNVVLGASQNGASYVKNIKLTAQMPNSDGTVSLCRYKGTKYITPTGGSEQSQGSYYLDRISAASGVNDPANAFVVKLFDLDGKFECVGTAILPDWVMTAGHCVKGTPSVAVGSTVTGAVNQWTIQRCIPYPRTCFNLPNPYMQLKQVSAVYSSSSADVALVRLASPLVLTRYGVPSAASTYKGDEVSAKFFTWQCNDAKANKESCPQGADTLASYTVTLWREHKCKTATLPYNDQLCSTGRTMVPGDSGGPAIYKNVIVGVNSGGGSLVGAKAIFADVTQLSQWIANVTGSMQAPTRL